MSPDNAKQGIEDKHECRTSCPLQRMQYCDHNNNNKTKLTRNEITSLERIPEVWSSEMKRKAQNNFTM